MCGWCISLHFQSTQVSLILPTSMAVDPPHHYFQWILRLNVALHWHNIWKEPFWKPPVQTDRQKSQCFSNLPFSPIWKIFIQLGTNCTDWMDVYNRLSDLTTWLNTLDCEHCDQTQLGLNPHVRTVWSSAVGFITCSFSMWRMLWKPQQCLSLCW